MNNEVSRRYFLRMAGLAAGGLFLPAWLYPAKPHLPAVKTELQPDLVKDITISTPKSISTARENVSYPSTIALEGERGYATYEATDRDLQAELQKKHPGINIGIVSTSYCKPFTLNHADISPTTSLVTSNEIPMPSVDSPGINSDDFPEHIRRELGVAENTALSPNQLNGYWVFAAVRPSAVYMPGVERVLITFRQGLLHLAAGQSSYEGFRTALMQHDLQGNRTGNPFQIIMESSEKRLPLRSWIASSGTDKGMLLVEIFDPTRGISHFETANFAVSSEKINISSWNQIPEPEETVLMRNNITIITNPITGNYELFYQKNYLSPQSQLQKEVLVVTISPEADYLDHQTLVNHPGLDSYGVCRDNVGNILLAWAESDVDGEKLKLRKFSGDGSTPTDIHLIHTFPKKTGETPWYYNEISIQSIGDDGRSLILTSFAEAGKLKSQSGGGLAFVVDKSLSRIVQFDNQNWYPPNHASLTPLTPMIRPLNHHRFVGTVTSTNPTTWQDVLSHFVVSVDLKSFFPLIIKR